ncbi:MAG: sulfurtransferase FdhD [Halioglobus sp.]|nr:sulfurtransferase FdhD [Halioglobus sp.]
MSDSIPETDSPPETGLRPRTDPDTPAAQIALNRLRYTGGARERASADQVAVEEPLAISLCWQQDGAPRRRAFSVTMRTPGHDAELALGLLRAEGVIATRADVLDCRLQNTAQDADSAGNELEVTLAPGIVPDWDSVERNLATQSSCGVCGKTSLRALALRNPPTLRDGDGWLDPAQVGAMIEAMRAQQALFRATGGTHGAALFDARGQLLALREDVGRHNALDKLLGSRLEGAQDMTQDPRQVVVLSGRASFELAQKAVMAAVPVVIAVGAPSSLAVRVARQHDLTLLGFAGEDGFSVYHGARRLVS